MWSFTVLRKTHSAVSSSLPSSDDLQQPSKSSPRTIPRHSFLIRVVVFILLEFGFIALVSAALHRPIILHVSFTNTEVKGAITAISIVWHALAVYVVKDILQNVFSAEWIAQHDGSQSLALQELDIVSRLTTGFIDQGRHCISKRATLPFRLSFLSSILLILLNGLGPSAIGADPVPYNYPSTTKVAKLTLIQTNKGSIAIGLLSASKRANTVIQLEVVENSTTVGYISRTPNVLIPWPSSDPIPENTTMRYQSDIIRYNFSCTWNIPIAAGMETWKVEDNVYQAYFSDSFGATSDPSITALEIISRNASSNSPSFLFGGAKKLPSLLNLEDIPHLLIHCNTSENPGFSHGQYCNPLLVSVLICDPQLEILPAVINCTASYLEATILSGDPTVKNIPPAGANALFATSLSYAISQDSVIVEQSSEFSSADIVTVSDISHQLFLPDVPFDLEGKNPLKPLSLQEINQNMNNILASTAKAYLNGYRPGDDNYPTRSSLFATVDTDAVMEVQKLALVGNKPFFVASSVTVGLLVVLLGALVAITRPHQLECFELENIVRKLR